MCDVPTWPEVQTHQGNNIGQTKQGDSDVSPFLKKRGRHGLFFLHLALHDDSHSVLREPNEQAASGRDTDQCLHAFYAACSDLLDSASRPHVLHCFGAYCFLFKGMDLATPELCGCHHWLSENSRRRSFPSPVNLGRFGEQEPTQLHLNHSQKGHF